MTVNFGDILFQLLWLSIMVLLVIMMIRWFRLNKQRREQLNKMEKRLSAIEEQVGSMNDGEIR